MNVHTLQIKLCAGFECLVDKLKCLPHGRRDALGGECAAVDNLENLIIQIYRSS